MAEQAESAVANTAGDLEAVHPSAKIAPDEALASIAISLKRLADAVDRMTTEACNEYGEPLHEAIGMGIARALRGSFR